MGTEPGGDPSIIIPLRGPQVVDIHEHREKDPTQLSDRIAGHVRDHLSSVGVNVQHAIGVDVIRIGRGCMIASGRVQKLRVYPIDVSKLPLDEVRYHRLRDQMYWELKLAFWIAANQPGS